MVLLNLSNKFVDWFGSDLVLKTFGAFTLAWSKSGKKRGKRGEQSGNFQLLSMAAKSVEKFRNAQLYAHKTMWRQPIIASSGFVMSAEFCRCTVKTLLMTWSQCLTARGEDYQWKQTYKLVKFGAWGVLIDGSFTIKVIQVWNDLRLSKWWPFLILCEPFFHQMRLSSLNVVLFA